MSELLDRKSEWLDGCHMMRDGLLEQLDDIDLAFSPGGQNPTIGEVLRAAGEVERSYIDSFMTFEQDFSYRHPDPTIASRLSDLRAWFQELDDAFKAALEAVPEEDDSLIQRSTGSTLTPADQVDIYVQAMMIFLGKAVVYFRAMNKDLPPSVKEYIA